MKIINYLLLAVFLTAGCTSVYGQEDKEALSKVEQERFEKLRWISGKLEIKWVEKAEEITSIEELLALAEKGDAGAQSYLGNMYYLGVPKDYQEAAKWFKLAAEQGDASAQFNLGLMYDNVFGVPKDHVLAYKWFNLATAQADELARKKRDDLAKKMTASQIQEAQKLSREFKSKKEKPKK